MLEPENRGFIVIASALSLCLFLYKIWGPVLILTISLVLVISTCYSLLVDDSIISPKFHIIFYYIKNYIQEVFYTLKHFFFIGCDYLFELFEYLKSRYLEQEERNIYENMNGRRGNVYRLSSDFSEQPSPIVKNQYSILPLNGSTDGIIHTSTPLNQTTWKKDIHQNGGIGIFTSTPTGASKKVSTYRCENRIPASSSSNEIKYSTKTSQWSNHTSSKVRTNTCSNSKPIQTVAGPLLTSNKYNIDPKVYTDVNSPGLTTRITKYACEANSRLTHQAQYGTGQFPKVNLNASPIPLISPKSIKSRAPVTVRIAPPESIPYSDTNLLTDQRKSYLVSHCELKQDLKSKNVNHVLKEISLKRHASKEDVMIDLVKKQRTDTLPESDFDNLEEIMQKRARDESLTSDEDVSPKAKNQRPLKRSKASSCHDILNSLSSSINVVSGVKRKTMDTSRCNTPDIEKHFKSSISPPKNTSLTFNNLENLKSKQDLKFTLTKPNTIVEKPQLEENTIKNSESVDDEILKKSSTKLKKNISDKVDKEVQVGPEVVKLTDKLFMRAEPQSNEKLKSLIREQGIIEAKFTTDDKDEIKKQDIDNMRQNSMRSRLQSMFDAISGKTAKSIDPNLVIQAENVNSVNTSNYATLNSSTTTTSINTSPITTSSIIPILKSDNEFKSSSPKHVTFNLPRTTSSMSNFPPTQSESNIINKPTSISASVSSAETTKSLSNNAVTQIPVLDVSNTSAISTAAISSSAVTSISSLTSASNFSKYPTSTAVTSDNSSTLQSNITSGFNTIPSFSGSAKASPMFNFGSKTSTPCAESTSTSQKPSLTFNFENKVVDNTVKSTNSNSLLPFASIASAPSTKSTTTTSATTSNVISAPSTNTMQFSQQNIVAKTSESAVPTFGSLVTTTPVATSKQTSTNSPFSFSNTSNNKQENFSFGSSTNPQIPSLFNTTSSSMNFSPGNNITTISQTSVTTSILTTPTASMSVTATPSLSFGLSSLQGKTNFSFNNLSTPVPEKTNSSSIFGGTPNTVLSTSNTTVPTTTSSSTLFGNNSVFGSSTTTGFNSPNVTTNSIFSPNTTASSSIFGNPTNSSVFGTPAPVPATTASLFSTKPSITTSVSTQPSFTNTNLTATPAGFGSTTSTLFSGTNTNVNTTTANSSNFTESSNIFGQQKSTFGNANTSFGKNNTSLNFASSVTTATNSIFNNSVPGSNSLPSFGTIKPVAQFGTPITTAPENQNTASIFGSSSMNTFSNNNESKTSFGNASSKPSSAPIFGSTTSSQAQTFGTTTNTFGTTTNTFGSPNQTSAFGSNVNAPSSSPFASQTQTLFGGAKSPSSTFTFGTTQSQQPQNQVTSSFSFSGTNSNQNSSAGLFQFGSNTNQQKTTTGGFNFNAPTGAPSINFTGSSNSTAFNAPATPAFNAPPANMFSIGAGSSTPRSRTSRQRRQR